MKKLELYPGQKAVFERLKRFIDDHDQKVFIIKGYAGTGKTTMIIALIEMLHGKHIPFSLLASTGRAAKVLSDITTVRAKTVHSEVYSFSGLNQNLDEQDHLTENNRVDETGQLLLVFEPNKVQRQNHIYVIDEASMVSDLEDKNNAQARFGSGRLLKDLLEFDPNGKFIFIGDSCQLPPIRQSISPALSVDYFKSVFNIDAEEGELTEIIRQKKGNGIVASSKKIRELYSNPQPWTWAKYPFRGFDNIHLLPDQTSLLHDYIKDIKKNGLNGSTLICSTNKLCGMYANLIRPSLGIHTMELSVGDLLLVTQNNTQENLMNGDFVTVESLGSIKKQANLTFQLIEVKELWSNQVHSMLIILDILYSDMTNLNQIQQKGLFIDFYNRMRKMGYKQNSGSFNSQMFADPYLNGLRAVYGYALTCHKAQGGEWDRIYLDIARHQPAEKKPYVYQWVYTAMTRAKKELYTVDDFWVI